MKKNFLLLIVFLFSLMFCYDMVLAADKIDCDYGKYRIVIDTEIYNSYTNLTDRSEGVDVYIDGKKFERSSYGNDIILRLGKNSYDSKAKIYSCPSSVYIWCLEQTENIIDNIDIYTYNPDIEQAEKVFLKVSCGSGEGKVTGIPKKIPELTSIAITIIQIAIPVILVIMGSLDLFKGITAGKEDEMKKGQQMFIKRLVLAAIIFFVVVIVKFLVSVVADTNTTNIVDCIDCFVSNDC